MKITRNNSTFKISRVAGMLFLLSLLVPALNWMFILSRFISQGSSTSLNILNNELLFRFNIVNGIYTTIIILALASCLYIILRSVNRFLALIAFILKIIEAVLTASLTMGHFMALLILKGEPGNIELQKAINLLVENYIFLTAIPGIFFGMSMLVYSYLLLKSGYVHFTVALSGIISYSFVVIYDSLVILFPCYAGIIPIQIIGSVPVCLFQIIFGFWLLFKGISITQTHKK